MKIFKKLSIKKLLPFVFYFFVFTLPLQTVFILKNTYINNYKFQYATINLFFFNFVAFFWINLVLLYFLKTKTNFKRLILFFDNKIIILTVLFVSWAFISTFWAPDKKLSLIYALNLFFALILFLATSFFVKNKILKIKKIAIVFLASAFIQSCLGLWQFVQQNTFSNKWLGIQSFNIWQGGAPVLQNTDGRWLRAYGGLPHPNIFAGFLLIALFFNFYLLSSSKNLSPLKKFFLFLALMVIFSSFLLSFSRSAFFSFFIGISFVFLFAHKKFSKKLLTPLLSVFLVFLLFLSLFFNVFLSRTNTNSRLEKNSISDRSLYVLEAEKIINRHPFIGIGLNNYTLTVYKQNPNKKPIWEYQPVHNVLILVVAELGLFGLFLFLGIIFNIIYSHSKDLKLFATKKFSNVLMLGMFLSLISLFVFDHWLWSNSFGVFLFWLIAGLAI